jgi:hypothetical protein
MLKSFHTSKIDFNNIRQFLPVFLKTPLVGRDARKLPAD